ncbi:MAG: glycosyltransferase family 4 protein [Gammaproteobacteria bacterium]|nr:glycosyltransferase family 4 protein [Gammaproteobacteria bacterium]
MKILHVLLSRKSLPPPKYGGTERVVWALSKAQQALGHELRFLWGKASSLPPNATVYRRDTPIDAQIGTWPDIVHFHFPYYDELDIPFVCTEHFNNDFERPYPSNTIFLSRKHADLNGADCFVYNGLDWSRYGEPNLTSPADYFHFIGKTRLATKNLRGAIDIAQLAGTKLRVLGGRRLKLGHGSYFYPERHVRFCGEIGGPKKHDIIRNSLGLICPVRWHEPFGLVIIESLFLGAPVFATPYGSLPELIEAPDIGFLSADRQELADAVRRVGEFDRRRCHEVARTKYGADTMAHNYMNCYERVINGEQLNARPPIASGAGLELLPFT